MLKASSKKPSAEDNNMFLLDYGSFYERKTGHLDKFFSAEDICSGLSRTQNHWNTQYMSKGVSK